MSGINYIQIFGERNSGTNFLQHLLEQNIEGVEVGNRYGWKHGFINFKKLQEQDLSHVLFLVLVKDPYSWIASMHKKPHHAPQLYRLEFHDFIRREWASYKGLGYETRDLVQQPLLPEEEMMHERNPRTGQRFENVILLRNAKATNFLKLKDFYQHYQLLNYEALLEDPEQVIRDIAQHAQLQMKDTFVYRDGYFGKSPNIPFDRRIYYEKKEYLRLYTQEDLNFVNQYLDENLERQLGYHIVLSLEDVSVTE